MGISNSDGNPLPGQLNASDIYVDSHNTGSESSPEWEDRVFAINHDKRIFIYAPATRDWRELPGNGRATSLAVDGNLVYIIVEDGSFYGIRYPDGKQWIPAGDGKGKSLAYSRVEIFHPFVRSGGKEVPTSSYHYLWTIGTEGRVFRAFVAH